jgi:hypothetical protein
LLSKTEKAVGYLKVSICVIGPGESPPSFNESDSGDDKRVNVIRSPMQPNVRFQPVIISLKLFWAEDLPQMDANWFDSGKQSGHGDQVQNKDVQDETDKDKVNSMIRGDNVRKQYY